MSDEAQLATYPTTAEVFDDSFSSGLDYFPFENSVFEAFRVDSEVKFSGTSSMRFNIPNVNNPNGGYAGAIFRTTSGRDLSNYNALTFWAKASYPGTVDNFGFGQDFAENRYLVTMQNVKLSTDWEKYIIPLPDPSKLTNERGLFWYSEGPENGNGYSIWVDEVKYEKLGNIGQYRPVIFNSESKSITGFVNSNIKVEGLTQTVNLGNGIDQKIQIAPSYFDFISSNPSIASVNSNGFIEIKQVGNTVITAKFNGIDVEGSLNIEAIPFDNAPTPTHLATDVISIFSNAYSNVNIDYYNGYWQPYQTTESSIIEISNNAIINYNNLNFVGIQFRNPTINASTKKYLHLDVYTTDPIVAESVLYVDLLDFNPPNSRGGAVFNSTVLKSKQWMSLEIDITTLGLSRRDEIGQIILNSAATLKNIYVDNIYFHN